MQEYPIQDLTAKQVASIVDHTFLKTEDAFSKSELGAVRGRKVAFDEFLAQVPSLKPYAICVRHYDVGEAVSTLESLGAQTVKVASVVGFPNAHNYVQPGRLHQLAIDEVARAYDNGAAEIDFVLPTDAFDWPIVENYVNGVHRYAHASGLITKLIIETSQNTNSRIKDACELADNVGIDFVKTSTGYGLGGATLAALDIMRHNFCRGIKISGGVTPENYQSFIEGAERVDNGRTDLNPKMIRIGASSLLPALYGKESKPGDY